MSVESIQKNGYVLFLPDNGAPLIQKLDNNDNFINLFVKKVPNANEENDGKVITKEKYGLFYEILGEVNNLTLDFYDLDKNKNFFVEAEEAVLFFNDKIRELGF